MSKIFIPPSIAAILAVIMWSFSFPASKVVYNYFSVIDIVLFRYVVASIFFLLVYMLGWVAPLKRQDLGRVIFTGLLGVTAYQLLFVSGVTRVTPAAASMIISMTPLFAAIIAFIALKQKMSKNQVIGTLVGFLGVVLISFSKGTDGTITGYAIMLLAASYMGAYFVLQKPLLERYSALDLVCYNTWFGCLSLLWGGASLLSSLSKNPSLESIISIVIMGVFFKRCWFCILVLGNFKSRYCKNRELHVSSTVDCWNNDLVLDS